MLIDEYATHPENWNFNQTQFPGYAATSLLFGFSQFNLDKLQRVQNLAAEAGTE